MDVVNTTVDVVNTTVEVDMTKIKTLGLGGFIGLALSLILLFTMNLKRTDFLVSLGSKTYKFLNMTFFILLVLSLLAIIASLVLFLMKHRQETTLREIEIEQTKDPLYEEASILSKLSTLLERYRVQTTTESKPYKDAINEILHQMEEAKTLSYDFAEIVENNSQPIIQNIGNELTSIRIHILSDAKSIYRRAIILEDYETIDAKIKHNRKLLEDADKLIIEAIRYIDVKSNPTDVDLKNLTESLKELMKMI